MKVHNWRLYFQILFSLNLIVIVIAFVFIFATAPQSDPLPQPVTIDEPGAEFTVQSTKSDLNELINDYLDHLLLAEGADFHVYIDHDIQLDGSFRMFGVPIPLNIRMDPIVQPNGDLVLSVTEMSLGLLNLPKDRILHYMNGQIDTPDWLYFDSQNEQLYVAVTQIDIQSNFRFSVQELDLSDENITFDIKIPQAGAS